MARWLLPGYFRGDQETAYARLESRFGVGTRRLTSLIFLVSRFLGDAVRVFASAIPLALITGWSVPTAIVVMGIVTMVYTWFGGFKAVVWTDVLQLSVYLAGGVGALLIAWQLAGGVDQALAARTAPASSGCSTCTLSLTHTYTLLSGIVGGALLSGASHGADHLIVQRLLATRSLQGRAGGAGGLGRDGDRSSSRSSCSWARRSGPPGSRRPGCRATQLFPAFVVNHLPVGLAGLVIAGILAAAMGTHSSAINSLASSATHDLYASWTGRRDPAHLLRVGRLISAVWALGLIGGALFFHATAGGGQTPVVVLALSIASVTYGPLLGTYFLAGRWPRARGRDVVGAVAITVAVMLVVVFAKRLADACRRSRGSSRSVGWRGRGTCRSAPCSRSAAACCSSYLPDRATPHSHGHERTMSTDPDRRRCRRQQDRRRRVRRRDDHRAGRRVGRRRPARSGARIGVGDRRGGAARRSPARGG